MRELENAVERAVIMCTGDLITERELPLHLSGAASDAPPAAMQTTREELEGLGNMPLEELERRAIGQTLREVDGNKSEAARRLGITRTTLHNKLKRYGLE